MKALYLEKTGVLSIREFDLSEPLGPDDVRIKIHTVGVCGSDVHYYQHGRIGPYVVTEPMVLGHEASGTIVEVGRNVTHLKPGDRVCMEPGIPDPNSRAMREGKYNLDPAVRFWATPPIHGVLRETVVHPAAFTFKLPDNISYAEGALVEPMAIGVYAARKAEIAPGDVAVVIGAGTIGTVTALAALAAGCSQVILTDVVQEKLDLVAGMAPVVPVNVRTQNLNEVVKAHTDGWGADIIFEASGSEAAAATLFEPLCPGGRVVYIGLPGQPVPLDMAYAISKEARILTIMRYTNIYPRTLGLMASGKIDLKPLITDTYPFSQAIQAFEYASHPRPTSVKVQIVMDL